MNAAKSRLVLIDLQSKLLRVIDGGDRVLDTARLLGDAAKRLDVPVTATTQNAAKLGPPANTLDLAAATVVDKMTFDCSDAAALKRAQPHQQPHLVLAGVEAHICVLQTAVTLKAAGLDVFVVVDAIGSRQQADLRVGINRMTHAGVVCVTAEMVLFEWLESAEHPEFRAISKLIK